MENEARIPNSASMIIARILPIAIAVISVILLLCLMIPDNQGIVSMDDETDVRKSVAYSQAVVSLRQVIANDSVKEIKSISYIYCDLSESQQIRSIKIVYDNGQEEKTAYFNETGEIDQKTYRANARVIILNYIIPGVKEQAARELTYNEYATGVIFDDAKGGS